MKERRPRERDGKRDKEKETKKRIQREGRGEKETGRKRELRFTPAVYYVGSVLHKQTHLLVIQY